MISISITPDSLSKALSDLDKYSDSVKTRVKKEVVRTAYAIDSKAKSLVREDKGRLRQSIHPEFTIGSLNVSIPSNGAVVGTNVTYASDIEFGTKPHTILPKNKSVLRWYRNGVFYFSKSVRHPGTRPYPFMNPAAESERQQFINNIVTILGKMK